MKRINEEKEHTWAQTTCRVVWASITLSLSYMGLHWPSLAVVGPPRPALALVGLHWHLAGGGSSSSHSWRCHGGGLVVVSIAAWPAPHRNC
jgi:hypothetical protein